MVTQSKENPVLLLFKKKKLEFIYLPLSLVVLGLWCLMGFLQLWWAGATLHCGARASHCLEHRLWACRLRGLRHVGSVVVPCRLSCSVACRIFLDQGSNLCPLNSQANSYPLYHQGSPQPYIFLWNVCLNLFLISSVFFLFFIFIFKFFYYYYFFFTLQYCICFAIYQHASATGVHGFN